VLEWIDSMDSDGVYLSVITIGELTKGIEKLPNSKRKLELSDWMENELLVRFQDKIVTLDVDILVHWGKMFARLEAKGRTLPAMDSLIAASALEKGFVLVTRNEADFDGTGVEIINPWKE
jgi:tRNA(fMet)-specific endonuclease VapC